MGANKLMHTVVSEVCHGCGKCAAVCPTNGIRMIEIPDTLATWHWPKPAATDLSLSRRSPVETGMTPA